MVERDFPDGRMQKLMGKPWSSWNLPEQPTELDLRKLRDAYMPPDPYRVHHQSTPLPPRYIALFGTHPDSDFLSITKCPACGWLMKVQHANKHFLRDSRGAIVCKDSDLAIFGNKVLGKACHPVGELTDTYSKKITLKIPTPHKSSHALRGTSSINEMYSKGRSGSGSHSTNKTDYFSTSPYRSRSHSQLHIPSAAYMQKGRSGSSTTSSSSTHGHGSINSSSSLSKSKSSKSHSNQSSSSSWSSLRSPPPPTKVSGSHKPPQSTPGSYTLSIPSEDMGQNESVEDLLMPNISTSHGHSKHTVHIIATSNSGNKSKSSDPDYDHIKFYSDVPEKRLKLDSHSRNSDRDHHRKTSDMHHDIFNPKQQLKHNSSSSYNGAGSTHTSVTESSSCKKSKSSSLSLSKNDSGSSNKHHLRSTAPSSIVTVSKPIVAVSSMSSGGHSRSHHSGTSGSSSIPEREKEKERSAPQKKKKRKRDKDEPRKIIPLKDRDFNPDKHCGVCGQGESAPCKRSLTCKTHSVAMRRAVVGRSQSFDALLAAHKLAKSEEKVSTTKPPKEPVEEPPIQITPPKPKKKKLSGSNSNNIGSSPNDLKPLAVVPEHTSYDRSGSPDIEVIEVRTKPKIPKPMIPSADPGLPKNYKTCPLVYPYTPDIQAKFEMVWYNPVTMDRVLRMTGEERHKFVFLLKHYKNPYFTNSEISLPLVKCCREKRNVFSNWNASEKPVEGTQQFNRAQDGRRQDDDGGVQFIGVFAKK